MVVCEGAAIPASASAVVQRADALYAANDKRGVYDLLVQAAGKFPTADILWRLARAEHDISLVTVRCFSSRSVPAPSDPVSTVLLCQPSCSCLPATRQTAPDEKKRLVYAAREHAAAALQLDDTNFACHKWAGITLSDVGDFEGTKV